MVEEAEHQIALDMINSLKTNINLHRENEERLILEINTLKENHNKFKEETSDNSLGISNEAFIILENAIKKSNERISISDTMDGYDIYSGGLSMKEFSPNTVEIKWRHAMTELNEQGFLEIISGDSYILTSKGLNSLAG